MTLELPNVCTTLERLMPIESSFDSRKQTIREWVEEQRRDIKKNLDLTRACLDADDIEVLHKFFRDLLMRNIVGESGEKLSRSLHEFIKTKADLTQENYERVLKQAEYRWGIAKGSSVMAAVVAYFRDRIDWKWQVYLTSADNDKAKMSNFPDDPLLKIENVGPKVRDLALSNFNSNYAAFDLHVIRVVSRIGLVAYGWELTKDIGIDFGTNPSNERNYLFFRRLFIKLASLSGEAFTQVDLDRIFWHLGRRFCSDTTDCGSCPIHDVCLTGRQRCSK